MDTFPTPSAAVSGGFTPPTAKVSAPATSNALAHAEGPVARAIEKQTAKMPSDLFLWAACGTTVASLAFQAAGMMTKKPGNALRSFYTAPSTFIGMWTSTFLLLGIYNKLVKVGGSDQLRR